MLFSRGLRVFGSRFLSAAAIGVGALDRNDALSMPITPGSMQPAAQSAFPAAPAPARTTPSAAPADAAAAASDLLTPFALLGLDDEQKRYMASRDMKRKDVLEPPPLNEKVGTWVPFTFMADAAPAQRKAFATVFPPEAAAAWHANCKELRATMDRDARWLMHPDCGAEQLVGTCTWHVLNELEKKKGSLFMDNQYVGRVKEDLDSYRKRIGYARMAPVAYEALLMKIKDKYKEVKVAEFLAKYKDQPISYFLVNRVHAGGVGDHNLHVEGKNGAIKRVST